MQPVHGQAQARLNAARGATAGHRSRHQDSQTPNDSSLKLTLSAADRPSSTHLRLVQTFLNAAQFYEAFLDGWAIAESHAPLKRLAGKTLKWKLATADGSVTFAFATNAKTAGLLPHLPGEFRLGIRWDHKVGQSRRTDGVSWFQYTTDEEAREFGTLQRTALEKFLSQPGKAGLRGIFNYSADPAWLPRANFDEFAYYFDADDAKAWGNWYGARIESWIARFTQAPEDFNAWCWRVLWPNAERPPQSEA